MLVDKHGKLPPFPRSRLINVRSMEISHQLGYLGSPSVSPGVVVRILDNPTPIVQPKRYG
jgi:hypothetical protein